MTKEEKMREYDGLIGLTMLNIYSMSKEEQTIRLCDFDRKNKEHLFILRIAYFARDLYHYPIEIDGSWWDLFCLNWKNRKGFNKVKRIKERFNFNISVPNLLDLMRSDGISRIGEDFSFADIYEEYYERKK